MRHPDFAGWGASAGQIMVRIPGDCGEAVGLVDASGVESNNPSWIIPWTIGFSSSFDLERNDGRGPADTVGTSSAISAVKPPHSIFGSPPGFSGSFKYAVGTRRRGGSRPGNSPVASRLSNPRRDRAQASAF